MPTAARMRAVAPKTPRSSRYKRGTPPLAEESLSIYFVIAVLYKSSPKFTDDGAEDGMAARKPVRCRPNDLLVMEGNHGVDSRGSQGGQVSRESANHCQNQGR